MSPGFSVAAPALPAPSSRAESAAPTPGATAALRLLTALTLLDIGVAPGAATKLVAAGPAEQAVAALAAEQAVVPLAAEQAIPAEVAAEPVLAAESPDLVVARAPEDDVGGLGAAQL